ncbi:Retrovirus-related Pol polyprotein from transposon 17.6 [Vitis vinifera]|uniref:Retrovirus-related Pol polyprotein from transposon 17.6 n=1 Tax=Vitis vinifera TaxID=29760 RepID=A0A438GIM9_VITVI|nr:Retrovirus-related Pol polyprotein from transposon 17.6 [Vitis vinifera]
MKETLEKAYEEFEENELEEKVEETNEIASINHSMQWKAKEKPLPLTNDEEANKEESPKLNLKPLPNDLKYAYLEEDKYPMVISSKLSYQQETSLFEVIRKCKEVIGWSVSDLKGISPLVCTHHIYLEENAKPIRQPQRRLNPHMQEVVRNEVLKLLQVGIIYSISDITWIEIALEDQQKTTFTCPFGTYEYRRMPFSLCNAPATFQRCMLSIFSDMVERIMEVFMDDLTIYGEDFGSCLSNLETILQRCIEKNLVLNWEKCYFMVEKDIVLGHVVSSKGINVDKAKIELIMNLPPPTNVKEVKQFLGHAGFYRCFIKDFSKLARPMSTLLAKDAKFKWDENCQHCFEELKRLLTTAPIVRRPNWDLPFEVMCDASDQAMGTILGQEMKGNLIIRKCVLEDEQQGILMKFHAYACGGHFSTQETALKVLQSGVDYVSKWVEAIACKHNDHKVVVKFLKENIFTRLGVPKAITSDGGTHFCNKIFNNLLARYGVKHKVATPYHSQTSGQVELANREIKNILMKVVNANHKDWALRIYDALWAY